MSYNGKDLPRVAVIIPCYNHEKYVYQALESIREQTYEPTVVVAIDDGSTDNSLKILDSYDMPIVVLHNDSPTGPSAARNKAIAYVWEQVDCFCMLDADDLYAPTKIEKSVVEIMKDSRIGIVYSDAVIMNEKLGTKIREYREPYSRTRLMQECIISNTPMISKLALQTSGCYDEGMRTAEDWDLWLRITKNFIAVHIPEALHYYRVTGQNSSDVVPHEIWMKNWELIRQRHQ